MNQPTLTTQRELILPDHYRKGRTIRQGAHCDLHHFTRGFDDHFRDRVGKLRTGQAAS